MFLTADETWQRLAVINSRERIPLSDDNGHSNCQVFPGILRNSKARYGAQKTSSLSERDLAPVHALTLWFL